MLFIYPFSIFFSIGFILIFLVRKNPSFPYVILSLIFLIKGISFLHGWLTYENFTYQEMFMLWFYFGFQIATGILIYLYVAFLTKKIEKIDFRILYYFIPLLVKYLIVVGCIFIYGKSVHYNITYLTFETLLGDLFFYLSFIITLGYFGFSVYLLHKYQSSLQNIVSNTKYYSLGWLKALLYTEICIFIAGAIIQVFHLSYFEEALGYYPILDIFAFILLVVLGVMAYRQDIFNKTLQTHFALINIPSTSYSGKQDTKPVVDDEIIEANVVKIESYMKENKPYLESDCNINAMSKDLKIPINILSRIINSHFGFSFFDFINQYRVNAVIELMKDSENEKFTLMSLAYDCGFNSKATFIRVFKKFTGSTPSIYYSKLKID